MIYLLSDLHGDYSLPGFMDYLENKSDDDLLIILGDTGLEFEKTEENKEFTEKFLSVKKNIALIDGNHENFPYLNSFPEEKWNGGRVRRLSEQIVLLERGNVYNIDGKSFFVFGGCKSSPKWHEMGLIYPGEEPTDEEINCAHANLEKYNFKVDYVLTHKYEETPPRGKTVCEQLQKLNRFIDDNVSFKKWYSGHWHKELEIDDKHIVIYDRLIALD